MPVHFRVESRPSVADSERAIAIVNDRSNQAFLSNWIHVRLGVPLPLGLMAWMLVASASMAASPEEEAAYNASKRAFSDKQYDWAERELASFVTRFPGSEHTSEAVLLQAQCRFELKQYDGVISLLSDKLDDPRQGDRNRYWLAQARLMKGEYETAATEFGRMVQKFPGSIRALEGSYGQAFAYYKLGRLNRVVELLQPADGVFRRAAAKSPDKRLVGDANLVLAEALIGLDRQREALDALNQVDVATLDPERQWRHAQLNCRALLVAGSPQTSMPAFNKAVEIAAKSGNADWIGEANQLMGRLLEKVPDAAGAVVAYERNLVPTATTRYRREALLRIIELQIAAGKTDETVQRMEQFIAQHPQDAVLDLAHLTIAELRLRDFYLYSSQAITNQATTPNGSYSNLLSQARFHLDTVVTNFPSSPHLGKALLARGWEHWAEAKFDVCQRDFAAAVTNLSPSADLVVAKFKLADSLMRTGDAKGALTNYEDVVKLAPKFAKADENLLEQALYQVVQAASASKHLASAESALKQLLSHSGWSIYAQPSLLLAGEAATDAGKSGEARRILSMFAKEWPNSPEVPEASLAIARTYVQERDWTNAVTSYGTWIDSNTNHAKLPQATFSLGWVNYLAGNETNALTVFTNFLSQFPTNGLAPLAQTWVADHYFRLGDSNAENWIKAEQGYLSVFQNTNWAGSDIAYQARLSAARVATARQGYKEALGYLTNLINDANAPTNLLARAYFALGDVLMNDSDLQGGDRWIKSIGAYSVVRQQFGESPLKVSALGRIGQCYLQLAAQPDSDAANFTKATESFQQVADSSADIATRSNGKMGLVQVFRAQARAAKAEDRQKLLEAALAQCLDVFYANSSFYKAGEEPHSFWVYQAGLTAAGLRVELGQLELAGQIYESMETSFPEQRNALRKARELLVPKPAAPVSPLSNNGGFSN